MFVILAQCSVSSGCAGGVGSCLRASLSFTNPARIGIVCLWSVWSHRLLCGNSSAGPTHTIRPSAVNMSSYRKYGRYSMNLTMEQERLQGWLSVASVVDSGKMIVFSLHQCLLPHSFAVLSDVQLLISRTQSSLAAEPNTPCFCPHTDALAQRTASYERAYI